VIEQIVSYRVRCDSDGCGKATGAHHDQAAITAQAAASGWETRTVPAAVSGLTLWRCPKCIKAGKFHERWLK
jgi:hypothetical protein